VRSHLIPKAVTRPSVRGNRLIESDGRLRPKSRWDSWYDDKLVTSEGEHILARYDSWAIEELCRLELIWKSWKTETETSLASSVKSTPGMPSFGLRKVRCKNPRMLRLFFLSLLWRAAATNRPEFREVHVDKEHLDRLRRMVHDGEPEPMDFYPTTLLQIASRGPAHNLTPIAEDNTFDIGDGVMHRHHIFRFYFDGLIAHMHRSRSIEGIEPFIVGCSPDLVVQMQLLNDSFQMTNLADLWAGTMMRWPDVIANMPNVKEK
jgi:hypothetical protein